VVRSTERVRAAVSLVATLAGPFECDASGDPVGVTRTEVPAAIGCVKEKRSTWVVLP